MIKNQIFKLILVWFAVASFHATAGFSERDAKVTEDLLERGFTVQESTVNGLIEIAKTHGKVENTAFFSHSVAIQLEEFLPFSPATLNALLDMIESSENSTSPIEKPEQYIQVIFKSSLLPIEILNRIEQLAKRTKNKFLKLACVKGLLERSFHLASLPKVLILLSLDREVTLSLPATLELLKTSESQWAESRITTFLKDEKAYHYLVYLLRSGDHFSDMSDALVSQILASSNLKNRNFLFSALHLTQPLRAIKFRKLVFSKLDRCLSFLIPHDV